MKPGGPRKISSGKKLSKKYRSLKKKYQLLLDNNTLHQRIDLQNQRLFEYARYEKIIESLLSSFSLYVNVVDHRGNIVYSNGAGLTGIGLYKHQLEGANIFKLYPHLQKFFNRAMKGKLVQFSNVGSYGNHKWEFSNWLIPVFKPGFHIVNIGLDAGYFQEIPQLSAAGKTNKMFDKKPVGNENEWPDKIKKVAHDLCSPLNSLAALMEIVALKMDDPKVQEDFDKIMGIIKRMKSLVINHLNTDPGKSALADKSYIDCETLIEDIKTDLSGIMGNARISIKNKNLPVVYGNATQLHQVFLNLIDNAIKFNDKKKPKIEISIKALKNHWRFAIKDNGIGIRKKHLSDVFNYKKRVGNARKIPGSGIGLSTCKSIIENHSGKIWVKSKVREGSVFYFSIPK